MDDNASANEAMVDELSELIPSFDGQVNWIWCFDHIVNLVAKRLLQLFESKGREATDWNDENEEGEDSENGEHDNAEVDLFEELDDDNEHEEMFEPVKKILHKVICLLSRNQCTI